MGLRIFDEGNEPAVVSGIVAEPADAGTQAASSDSHRRSRLLLAMNVVGLLIATGAMGFGGVLMADALVDPGTRTGTMKRYVDHRELGIGGGFAGGGAALAVLAGWCLLRTRWAARMLILASTAIAVVGLVLAIAMTFDVKMNKPYWFTTNISVKIPAGGRFYDSRIRARALVESLRSITASAGGGGELPDLPAAQAQIRLKAVSAMRRKSRMQVGGRDMDGQILELEMLAENLATRPLKLDLGEAVKPVHLRLGTDGFRLLKPDRGPMALELRGGETREVRLQFLVRPGFEASAFPTFPNSPRLEVKVQGETQTVGVRDGTDL